MTHDMLHVGQVWGHFKIFKKVDLVIEPEFLIVSVTNHVKSVCHLVFSHNVLQRNQTVFLFNVAFGFVLEEQCLSLAFQELVSADLSKKVIVTEIVQDMQWLLGVCNEDGLLVKTFQNQSLDKVCSQSVFLFILVFISWNLNLQKLRVYIFQNRMNSNRAQNAFFKLSLSLAARCKQTRTDKRICLAIGWVFHHDRNQIPPCLFWQVVSVANKQTKFVKLETFKSVQNQVDGFRVNVFKIGDFWDFDFLLS